MTERTTGTWNFPPEGMVCDDEGRYWACADVGCLHEGCYADREARARARAAGHPYKSPGYCFECGVREDLHG